MWPFKSKHRFPPLPEYPKLAIADIPAASALLFYNGNKVTELVGRELYNYKYRMPAFHAALFMGGDNREVLNVGKLTTIVPISKLLVSTRRIDAIVYKDLTEDERLKVVMNGMRDLRKVYDVKGFLGFGRKLPLIGNLLYKLGLRGRESRPFCSDNVVDSFNSIGYKVSNNTGEQTAPWDLQLFAEDHPGKCAIYTIWEGKKYVG